MGFDTGAPSLPVATVLTSLRERTEFGGGTFDVRSAVGEGTLVTVRFPTKEPLWEDRVLDLSRDSPRVRTELRRLVEYGRVEVRDGDVPIEHLVAATRQLTPPMKRLQRALGVLPEDVSRAAFALYGSVAAGILQVGSLTTACRREQADAAAKGRPWTVAGARRAYYDLAARDLGRIHRWRAQLRRRKRTHEEWDEVSEWACLGDGFGGGRHACSSSAAAPVQLVTRPSTFGCRRWALRQPGAFTGEERRGTAACGSAA